MVRLWDAVITGAGSYLIHRELQRPGEILVEQGEDVTADQVIARTEAIEQHFTLFVTNELGVEAENLEKYLSKSVGSTVKQDDVVARMRRGLRSTVVKSPVDGTLIAADQSAGTATISASVGVTELLAMVDGVVEQVDEGGGVWIRTSGSRLLGSFAFGHEARGSLVVGVDRPDRELTADQVSSEWKDGIVLAGMTAGVPALNRMREVGVAAVIMGSTTEGDIRRFAQRDSSQNAEESILQFWGAPSRPTTLPSLVQEPSSMMVFVTEGFGRQPMHDAVYSLLRSEAGSTATILNPVSRTGWFERPALYLAGEEMGEDARTALGENTSVRLLDPSRPGIAAVCQGEPYMAVGPDGVYRSIIDVVLSDGTNRTAVPISSLEAVS